MATENPSAAIEWMTNSTALTVHAIYPDPVRDWDFARQSFADDLRRTK